MITLFNIYRSRPKLQTKAYFINATSDRMYDVIMPYQLHTQLNVNYGLRISVILQQFLIINSNNNIA